MVSGIAHIKAPKIERTYTLENLPSPLFAKEGSFFPFAKGRKEGFSFQCLHHDRLINFDDYWLFFITWMPAVHMLRMSFEVSAGLEVMVIKFEVQMVGLEVDKNHDARNSPGELLKALQRILGLKGDAFLEFFIVNLGAASDLATMLPGTLGLRMVRPSSAEFSPAERFHRGPHVGVMRGAEPFEDTRQARWVWEGPFLIRIIPKTQARNLWISVCTKDRVRTHAVKHPEAGDHGVRHKSEARQG